MFRTQYRWLPLYDMYYYVCYGFVVPSEKRTEIVGDYSKNHNGSERNGGQTACGHVHLSPSLNCRHL